MSFTFPDGNYEIVAFPSEKALQDLNKKEQSEFWRWFLASKNERVRMIEDLVKRDTEWSANFELGSLEGLGIWLVTHVRSEYRERIDQGIPPEDAASWSGTWLENDYELSTTWLSIGFDIGIYLGEVIIRNKPGVQWELCVKGGRTFIDYGQPCLSGLAVSPWSPVHAGIYIAYKALDPEKGRALVELAESVIS